MKTKATEWIVTEHRQIVVKSEHPLIAEDAMRCVLSGKHPEYVVSDHTRRDCYPVRTER